MYYTYILKSMNNKYYIGYTRDVNERLRLHNSGQVISTRSSLPWQLFYKEEFESERDAIIRERQLKAWKSRKALERLKFFK
ncbi:MAG: hypothetical protein A3B10_01515 [Candidatus Doudnabacteria bacterium RIFCSPLOWO2_01_FULL_44_21]|uniref:GIY-YIG domain-containing protein n=1 Tax=Candidatus Doudnabacteria bacterium RIFCSPLOWO2_01_FULL_44_21 TaxID=1817841 RepID=A0A1F5PXZ0_9BACT|nr:MAG: hypothetical protein A3B10_01515 [Candidatus Doudnabacteria bacterium RIFCSPLOWO2_01_FULL_44_21]